MLLILVGSMATEPPASQDTPSLAVVPQQDREEVTAFMVGLERVAKGADVGLIGTLRSPREEGAGRRTVYALHVSEVLFSKTTLEPGAVVEVFHPGSNFPDAHGRFSRSPHGGAPRYLPSDSEVLFLGAQQSDGRYLLASRDEGLFLKKNDEGHDTVGTVQGPHYRLENVVQGAVYPAFYVGLMSPSERAVYEEMQQGMNPSGVPDAVPTHEPPIAWDAFLGLIRSLPTPE